MPKNPVSYKGAACTTGHGCDAVTTVLGGSPDVFVGMKVGDKTVTNPVLRQGDPLAPHTITNPALPLPPPCVDHLNQVVNTGSAKVFVNGIPIARVGDLCDIGGSITEGVANVIAGG